MARADRYTAKSVEPIWLAGFTNTFSKNPVTGILARTINVDQAKVILRNLIMTRQGEIPFEPLNGSKVAGALFELDISTTALLVRTSIEQTINNNLQGLIKLVDVKVQDGLNTPGQNPNALVVTIFFLVMFDPQVQSVSVPLKRVR